ncbi:MAG: hypothetical protein Ct9H300mP13_2090 [Gammaproteobacteria bacterium]|nr:MAG: hypothetical protein Ct9H300mP13_2090 [Gammaproteobacteria bacterium]
MSDKTVPGDGVVTGFGHIMGVWFLFSAKTSPFLVVSVRNPCRENLSCDGSCDEGGCPVIGLNDSGGPRIQEGIASLGPAMLKYFSVSFGLRCGAPDLNDYGAMCRWGGVFTRDH